MRHTHECFVFKINLISSYVFNSLSTLYGFGGRLIITRYFNIFSSWSSSSSFVIIVIISLISFFFPKYYLNITYSQTFVWGLYTTRNINTLINKHIVWPTKKVSKIYKLLKKIIFGLNSLYCPVIIDKISTAIKDKEPISWLLPY